MFVGVITIFLILIVPVIITKKYNTEHFGTKGIRLEIPEDVVSGSTSVEGNTKSNGEYEWYRYDYDNNKYKQHAFEFCCNQTKK